MQLASGKVFVFASTYQLIFGTRYYVSYGIWGYLFLIYIHTFYYRFDKSVTIARVINQKITAVANMASFSAQYFVGD